MDSQWLVVSPQKQAWGSVVDLNVDREAGQGIVTHNDGRGARTGLIGDQEVDLGRRNIEQRALLHVEPDANAVELNGQDTADIGRRNRARGEGQIRAVDGRDGIRSQGADGLGCGVDDAVRGIRRGAGRARNLCQRRQRGQDGEQWKTEPHGGSKPDYSVVGGNIYTSDQFTVVLPVDCAWDFSSRL